MVRSPSGVTRMKLRAVAGPSSRGSHAEWTPTASRSWAKRRPVSSSLTLPMKPARTPSDATPTAVLAAEPPEMIVAGPMLA